MTGRWGSLLLGLMWLAPTVLAAQQVRGVVVDQVTQQPVPLATVQVVEGTGDVVRSTLTDDDGFFSVRLDRGVEAIVRISALGYRPSRVGPLLLEEADALQVVQVSLEPAPVRIEGVSVSARDPRLAPTGFYERMEAGRGQFLTPADVASSEARWTPELFHGLNNVIPQYGRPMWQRSVQYLRATDRGRCTPRIFIDDVRWGLWAPGQPLMDAVPLEDVLAVEVFWGPFQAPMKYQGTITDNDCGVVLIWTRYGRR